MPALRSSHAKAVFGGSSARERRGAGGRGGTVHKSVGVHYRVVVLVNLLAHSLALHCPYSCFQSQTRRGLLLWDQFLPFGNLRSIQQQLAVSGKITPSQKGSSPSLARS